MTGATWKPVLQAVFQGINTADDISPEEFLARLKEASVAVDRDLENSFLKPQSPEEQKKVIQSYWELAHLDSGPDIKSPKQRRAVYAALARNYDRLFEREDAEAPGWILLPPPFFP